MATPRTGVSHAMAAARATATAAAAITIAMVAIPASPADAFVNPPAAFPSPSTIWQRGAATTLASPLTPKAAAATALFSRSPIAADTSEREPTGAKSRVAAAGRERRRRRFSSGLGRPLYSSSSGGDSGTPESGEEGRDEDAGAGPPPGMSESEKVREKLETIAKTAAPVVDGASGGLTKEEQEALEELQEDRRVDEELERLEAAQKAKGMDAYLYVDGEEEEDPDAAVRADPAGNNRINKKICCRYSSWVGG